MPWRKPLAFNVLYLAGVIAGMMPVTFEGVVTMLGLAFAAHGVAHWLTKEDA